MMEISDSQLQRLATSAIRPGDVYRLKLTPKEGVKPKNDGDDSRTKYFVVMGITDDGELIGFVLINSEINQNIPDRIKKSHFKICTSDYSFLKKDSYVCCGDLKEICSADFFNRFNASSVGSMTPEHMDAISSIVAMSSNVSVNKLKAYGII